MAETDTSSILCKMYYDYNGTLSYIADRRIIIPTRETLPSLNSEQTSNTTDKLDPPWYPESQDRTIERIEEWSGGAGYTLFGVEPWQPLESTGTIFEAIPYESGRSMWNINFPYTNLWELFVDPGEVDAIVWEFTDADHVVRRIRCQYRSHAETAIDRSISCDWFYIDGNVVRVTLENVLSGWTRYYRDNSTTVRIFTHVFTIPWIYKNNYEGFTNEGIYNFNYELSYERHKYGTNWGSIIVDNLGGYAAIQGGYGSEVGRFKVWLGTYEPKPYDPDNPFTPGGISSPFGPLYPDEQPGVKPYNPNFSEETDKPTADTLPTISATGSGFATIFKPSISQLRDLANKMWNGDILYSIRNLIENVNDLFVSLAMVPFNVPAGNTVSVVFLNLLDTGVSLTLAAQQFLEFDMGTINLGDDTRAFTSDCALDYSPFSRIGIYLPFIGYRDIDIDEVRGKSIKLIYRIDILSGACVAIVRVGGADLYQFSGNCLAQIPITNQSISSLISDAVNLACAVVAPVEIGAAAAASEIANADAVSAIGAHSTMNQNIGDAFEGAANSGLQSATVNSIMGMKPMYPKTGSISGASAMMSVKQPYLYLVTPRQAVPEYYQKYCGFPSNITGKLSEFSGYTVVEDIRLNGLVATAPEVAEIYELLKKGVII